MRIEIDTDILIVLTQSQRQQEQSCTYIGNSHAKTRLHYNLEKAL